MQLKMFEFKGGENEITIICDKKEERIISLLKKEQEEREERKEKNKINIVEESLKIGDFVLSDRVVIERKTVDDFFKSIIDNRLFEQSEGIKSYEVPIILIEGTCEYMEERAKKVIYGAMLSLILDHGIHLIFTESPLETAQILIQIARREQIKKKRPVRLIEKKKALTSEEEKLRVLQSFPQIGPKLAHKLLSNFKSLKSIFNAEQKDLERIVGKKKAEKFKKLIESNI